MCLQTVDGRRSAYDPDELEEEQRDRERRQKINHEFRRFTKKVQDQWDRDFAALKLEWDSPFRSAPATPPARSPPAPLAAHGNIRAPHRHVR